MSNKKEIRKAINLVENWIREDASPVEIANYSIDQKDEFQAAVKNVWPDVMYHGLPILNGSNTYYDQLSRLVDAKATSHGMLQNYQESYLGYDMDEDVFYSGYDGDPWEDPSEYDSDEEYEENYGMGGAVFMIKVVNGKLNIVNHESTDRIYMSTYKELHLRHPNLVDLRLD